MSGGDETLHITGSADDLEYFDNGLVGKKGDDWFRIEYKGREPRLFTANLTLPDTIVVAQLQFFLAGGKEFREGANPNERVHQQLEGHRTGMTRTLQPGGVYYLRVESNSGELLLDLPTDLDGNVRYCLYNHCGELLGRSDGTHTTVCPCLRMESWPRAGQARGAPHQTPQP